MPVQYKTELEILIGCQNRQPKAQAALYDKYKGRLLGICRRYCRTVAEAEDIFQDAFVKIFLKIETLNKAESLGGWVKSVVVHTATDHYRKTLKHNALIQFDGQEVGFEEQNDDLEIENIEREKLLEIINSMPNGYRLAINMFYIDGFKHTEIAEMLGISLSTSKTQLFHAKAWLKNKIEKLKLEFVYLER